MTKKWFTAITIAAYCMIALIVYGPSLRNGFVAWDDPQLLHMNPTVKGGLTKTAIKRAFSTYDPELYVPLTMLSYQAEYTLAGGFSAPLTHTTNLLLHTASAILLAFFTRRFTKKFWLGIIAGLLFLVHPLHTEAVAWASARKDVLSGFFFMLSLLSYMTYREQSNARHTKWYVLSLLAFLLALFSKVMAASLPIIVLLIEWYLREKGSLRPWLKHQRKVLWPFFGLSIVFIAVALFGKEEVLASTTLLQKILMAGKSTVFYLQKFLWPTNLAVLYPYTKSIRIGSPDFFIPWILLILFAAMAVWSLRSTKIFGFGFLFFLLTLLPTFTNFHKSGVAYFASDRYAYIPSIGLIVIVVCGADWLLENAQTHAQKKQRARMLMGVATAVMLILSVLAAKQSRLWQNTETLFAYNTILYPNASTGHFNLGVIYRDSGRLEEALERFQRVIALENSAAGYIGVASILRIQGKREEAVAMYQEALKRNPKDAKAHYGLGIIEAERGNQSRAETQYTTALALDPMYTAAYNNYGSLLSDQEKYVQAEVMFRKAIALLPDFAEGHFNLGIVLAHQKKFEEAVSAFVRAGEFEPNHADTWAELSAAYLSLGRFSQALSSAKQALAIDPQNEKSNVVIQLMIQKGIVGSQKPKK